MRNEIDGLVSYFKDGTKRSRLNTWRLDHKEHFAIGFLQRLAVAAMGAAIASELLIGPTDCAHGGGPKLLIFTEDLFCPKLLNYADGIQGDKDVIANTCQRDFDASSLQAVQALTEYVKTDGVQIPNMFKPQHYNFYVRSLRKFGL